MHNAGKTNLSLVSKVTVAMAKAEEPKAELVSKASLGETIVRELYCRDLSQVTLMISEVEKDIDNASAEHSFSSFSNTLSTIAIIVAITALLPAFEPLLENGQPSSLAVYIALAVALLSFSLLLLGQSVCQLIQRARQTKVIEELREVRDALVVFVLTRKIEDSGLDIGIDLDPIEKEQKL